jgi:hypothetical protein
MRPSRCLSAIERNAPAAVKAGVHPFFPALGAKTAPSAHDRISACISRCSDGILVFCPQSWPPCLPPIAATDRPSVACAAMCTRYVFSVICAPPRWAPVSQAMPVGPPSDMSGSKAPQGTLQIRPLIFDVAHRLEWGHTAMLEFNVSAAKSTKARTLAATRWRCG